MTVEIRGLRKLVSKLNRRIRRARENRAVSVTVAYGTHYAVYVHEDLVMNHPRGGQARFLAQAVTDNIHTVQERIRAMNTSSQDLGPVLLDCGRLIRRASQMLVPVDTGLLRSTAHETLERG